MAAQRIVLTSPWKLGLFVFLLVIGTGFGLIYAYLELFGSQPDLENPEHVRLAYAVLGGVAALGLLGYLATVTSARPMDRVVRGNKSQQKVLKSLAKVQDAREVDPEDFKEISAVAVALERWREDALAAQDAGVELAEAREQIAELESTIEEARGTSPSSEGSEAEITRAADAAVLAPIAAALRSKYREIGSFIDSIGDCAADLSQRVHPADGATPAGGGSPDELLTALRKSGERLTQVRTTLDDLAEQANKLAITAALQISRLGEGSDEIVTTAEEIRSLSTQFQRTAADLRVCESDHSANLQKATAALAGGAVPGGSVEGLDAIVMVLDQSTEGLSEVLGQLRAPLQQLEALGGDAATVESPVAPSAVVDESPSEVESAPEPPRALSPDRPVAPESEPRFEAPVEEPSRASGATEIYDIADLGGVELEGDADDDEKVYDMEQFGAVEL